MTYPMTTEARTAHVRTDLMKREIETLSRLDLDPATTIPTVLTAYERYKELRSHKRPEDRRLADDKAALADRVFAGDLTPEEAEDQLARTKASMADADERSGMLKAAIDRAAEIGWHQVKVTAPGLVYDVLSPMVDDAVAETIRIAPSLPPEIVTAADALAAGTEVAQTWSTLTKLSERWRTIRNQVFELQVNAALPLPLRYDEVWQERMFYRHPHRIPMRGNNFGGRRNPQPAALAFARLIASGCEPHLVTIDEYLAAYGTPEQRQARAQADLAARRAAQAEADRRAGDTQNHVENVKHNSGQRPPLPPPVGSTRIHKPR